VERYFLSQDKKGDVLHLFANYYNRVHEGVINERFQVEHSDYTTPEYITISFVGWKASVHTRPEDAVSPVL
jgi:hypothetical protein